jgi:RimJ/RimL family protein N-acetyltransferase
MDIRLLTGKDAAEFQRVRLFALKETPAAFASSYEEECDITLDVVATRLESGPDQVVYGAFDGATLVGTVGVGRETMAKLRHKAVIWGMHIAPSHRGQGLGKLLLDSALAHARAQPGLRQLNLCVAAENDAALKLYEAAGFEVFGNEKDAMLIDGEWRDELHMARLLRG